MIMVVLRVGAAFIILNIITAYTDQFLVSLYLADVMPLLY